jgi:hypothetical protein
MLSRALPAALRSPAHVDLQRVGFRVVAHDARQDAHRHVVRSARPQRDLREWLRWQNNAKKWHFTQGVQIEHS